jgi:hypothetical protein
MDGLSLSCVHCELKDNEIGNFVVSQESILRIASAEKFSDYFFSLKE